MDGYRKSGFRRTKALISLKRGDIGPKLLLRSNRNSYTRSNYYKMRQYVWSSEALLYQSLAIR